MERDNLSHRRIQFEMKNTLQGLVKDWGYIVNKQYMSNQEHVILKSNKIPMFVKLYSQELNAKITIEIPINYPFTPPSQIIINDHFYLNLLKINFRLLQKVNIEECLCCNSLTCPGIWSPSHTIKHIFDEINKNLKIKKLIAYTIICYIIKKKYLNSDIDLISYFFF